MLWCVRGEVDLNVCMYIKIHNILLISFQIILND